MLQKSHIYHKKNIFVWFRWLWFSLLGFQKFCYSSSVSHLCGGACLPSLASHWFDWSPHPGVKEKRRCRCRKRSWMPGLAGQCLAKDQTLGCQGGRCFFTHCGFGYLGLYENKIFIWRYSWIHVALESRILILILKKLVLTRKNKLSISSIIIMSYIFWWTVNRSIIWLP